MQADYEYQRLLQYLLRLGERVLTRGNVVRRTFCWPYRFDQTPLIGLRQTAWKNALREWEWFLGGSSRIDDLHPSVRLWWKPWADEEGCVPFNYAEQFRSFAGVRNRVDQIDLLVKGVRDHPYSRRNVITTWNTADMTDEECPITNCHGTVIQAFVDTRNRLHLKTYQRSVDVVCGLPHNWLQYWAFLLWLAHRTKRDVGTLLWEGGDVHLYDVHEAIAERMVAATPSPVPALVYQPSTEEFRADDFSLDGKYHPGFRERAVLVV